MPVDIYQPAKVIKGLTQCSLFVNFDNNSSWNDTVKKSLYFFVSANLLLFSFTATAIDVSKLAPITPENRADCVEYYHYKGELYCSTVAQDSQPIDAGLKDAEKLKIVFDTRPWQLAWGKQTPEMTMIEYVPNGDNINDWHELVTSQFFPGLQEKTTPLQYAELIIQKMKEAGYKPVIKFFQKSNDQVIFEFRIAAPENQKQDELQLIRSDDQGIYVLHYVIKEADMGQKNRDVWLQNLKNSKIKTE